MSQKTTFQNKVEQSNRTLKIARRDVLIQTDAATFLFGLTVVAIFQVTEQKDKNLTVHQKWEAQKYALVRLYTLFSN